MDLRRIGITGSKTTRSNSTGRFVSVSYLEGDEREAASLFVEENGELLERVDVTAESRRARTPSERTALRTT